MNILATKIYVNSTIKTKINVQCLHIHLQFKANTDNYNQHTCSERLTAWTAGPTGDRRYSGHYKYPATWKHTLTQSLSVVDEAAEV